MVKNPPTNAGDTRDVGLIPDLGQSSGVGNDDLLQYSYLENSMVRGAWQAQLSVHAYRWHCLNVESNPQISEKFSLSILLDIFLVIHLCVSDEQQKENKKRQNPFLDFLFLMCNMAVCFLKSCF